MENQRITVETMEKKYEELTVCMTCTELKRGLKEKMSKTDRTKLEERLCDKCTTSASRFIKDTKRPIFDKTEKNEANDPDLMFIKCPTNLRYYMYLTDYGFNESALAMYLIIIDRFNKEKKYAYPSQYTLALETGRSIRTINSNIRILESVGLLETRRTGIHSNNEYIPKLPLSLPELLATFPKAEARYLKHQITIDSMRRHDDSRRESLLQEIVIGKRANTERVALKEGTDELEVLIF
ncbi:helix-turn-helix domain-containing protein [Bacillus wiedmannii]|uniref:helix-turn-helix domain-containing protein n=1 Tax=Bacillus wiedmannii TaxID=1890302 RepID=UPI0020CE755F|nr:helix-turn-helix domain-containing protein [Bacillus wiedmannii]MCP9280136.1 helix-turn-helix domain-containing protein [Bacillus wiedmannii]